MIESQREPAEILEKELDLVLTDLEQLKKNVPESLALEEPVSKANLNSIGKTEVESRSSKPRHSKINSFNLKASQASPGENLNSKVSDMESIRYQGDSSQLAEPILYWRSNIPRKVKVDNILVNSKYFEVAFKTIFPKVIPNTSFYPSPLRFILMEAPVGYPVGIKMYLYSIISSKICGMFFPIDHFLAKKRNSAESKQSESEQKSLFDSVDNDLFSLHDYFERLSWDILSKVFHFETIGEYQNYELKLLRLNPFNGIEISFRSFDTLFDFGNTNETY